MSEAKKGFDLASVLKNVSGLDTTSREQIEYIDIDLIDGDPANFYELSEIDALAANIELIGLQQPLRVRDNADVSGHVTIVSGHRRRAAIRKLVDEGRDDLRQIACIREQQVSSPALQELRLIYANSDTRRMSIADISKQVLRVEALLYQLKEEGYEFPGRMRDHVAEACKVSKSKIARLKVIRDNLAHCWEPAFESGALTESVAYALARLPGDHQRQIWKHWTDNNRTIGSLGEDLVKEYEERLTTLDKQKCKNDGSPCQNKENKVYKALNTERWLYCGCVKLCCADCADLGRCKYACPKLADRVAQIKADAKEQRKQEKFAQEEKDRPLIKKIQSLWDRFGQARNAAGVSAEDAYKALGRYCYSVEDSEIVKFERLEEKFTVDTELPYEYNCRLEDIEKFVRLADLFNCSIDYLFCRVDSPGGFVTTAKSAAVPTADVDIVPAVWYSRDVEPPIGAMIIVMDVDGWTEKNAYIGCGSLDDECTIRWSEVVRWTLSPTTSLESVPVPVSNCWRSGDEKPAEPMDAVAVFTAEGLVAPLRRIARWNGSVWQFPGGASIDAKCVRWLQLPPEE